MDSMVEEEISVPMEKVGLLKNTKFKTKLVSNVKSCRLVWSSGVVVQLLKNTKYIWSIC